MDKVQERNESESVMQRVFEVEEKMGATIVWYKEEKGKIAILAIWKGQHYRIMIEKTTKDYYIE